MKEKTYISCPICGKNYVGRIPKGGDGSALFLPRHWRQLVHINNRGATYQRLTREICPGSYQEEK